MKTAVAIPLLLMTMSATAVALAAPAANEFVDAADVARFPAALQRFFRYAKFDPARPMRSFVMHSTDVDFQMDTGLEVYKLVHYHQRSALPAPMRSIDMRAMVYRIFPMDVTDRFVDGHRRVKGTFAKVFPTFDVQGKGHDSYALCAFLAEAAYMPSVFLLRNISLSEVDAGHFRARLGFAGTEASVLFRVDEVGRIAHAEVQRMYRTRRDGTELYEPWTMAFSDYEGMEGRLVPTHFTATYHSDGYDLVEYDGRVHEIFYDV